MPQVRDFIVIARIVRPQGRRGEVLAEVLTDFPEKFAERSRLWLGRENDTSPQEYRLASHWFHKGRVVFKLEGVESISDAERLKGFLVHVQREERAELAGGAVYVSDLVGSVLVDTSTGNDVQIGEVEDVRQSVGAAPLLVVRREGNEYEIPFAEEYIVGCDGARKILRMKLPGGLLEINAPLTDEEKRRK